MPRKGQADLESAAVRVRERDAAAVVLDELADDRQPESGTGAGIGAWPAPEAVKRPDPLFGREPGAIIRDGQDDVPVGCGGRELHVPRADADRVVEPAWSQRRPVRRAEGSYGRSGNAPATRRLACPRSCGTWSRSSGRSRRTSGARTGQAD